MIIILLITSKHFIQLVNGDIDTIYQLSIHLDNHLSLIHHHDIIGDGNSYKIFTLYKWCYHFLIIFSVGILSGSIITRDYYFISETRVNITTFCSTFFFFFFFSLLIIIIMIINMCIRKCYCLKDNTSEKGIREMRKKM